MKFCYCQRTEMLGVIYAGSMLGLTYDSAQGGLVPTHDTGPSKYMLIYPSAYHYMFKIPLGRQHR